MVSGRTELAVVSVEERQNRMDLTAISLDEFLCTGAQSVAAPAYFDFQSAVADAYCSLVGVHIRSLGQEYDLHEVLGSPSDILLLHKEGVVGCYAGPTLAIDDAHQGKSLTVPLILAAVVARPLPTSRQLVPGGKAALTKAWRVANAQIPNPWP